MVNKLAEDINTSLLSDLEFQTRRADRYAMIIQGIMNETITVEDLKRWNSEGKYDVIDYGINTDQRVPDKDND